MKKILLIFIIFIAYSFAKININSLHSHFVQTITNEENKTITYKGEVWFKSPLMVKWVYKKPIYKEIHIIADKVVILEPELEQATISHLPKEANLFAILQNAIKIGSNHYRAHFEKRDFDIYLADGKLKKIRYKDELGNINEIEFVDVEQNVELPTKLFGYKLDPSWDIVEQ